MSVSDFQHSYRFRFGGRRKKAGRSEQQEYVSSNCPCSLKWYVWLQRVPVCGRSYSLHSMVSVGGRVCALLSYRNGPVFRFVAGDLLYIILHTVWVLLFRPLFHYTSNQYCGRVATKMCFRFYNTHLKEEELAAKSFIYNRIFDKPF